MKFLTKTALLALSLGASGVANASMYTFSDSTAALVSESASINRSISYSGLVGTITSATLTLSLSDDQSSTAPTGFVDVPVEYAELTVGGTVYTSGDIDGNNVSVPFPLSAVATEADLIAGGTFSLTPPSASATPNPLVGTLGDYFGIDVTSLLSGPSGSLSFDLTALDTIANFNPVPFLFAGVPYTEDFNYASATLTIETSPVPVPAAAWLMGSGLLGLLGFSRKRSMTV